jgi:hypothetical protein
MGRPLTEDAAYAKQHGVPKRFIQRRGGAQKLRLLEGSYAWKILMQPHVENRRPYLIQPACESHLYFEELISEEDVEME